MEALPARSRSFSRADPAPWSTARYAAIDAKNDKGGPEVRDRCQWLRVNGRNRTNLA